MECRVKSTSRPTATWYKDGVPIREGALFSGPSAEDAGQYRCNIKNDDGETNANLALNFEQETEERHEKSPGRKSPRERREKDSASPRPGSRPGTPRKSIRSRTATPTQEIEKGTTEEAELKTHKTSKMQKLDAEGDDGICNGRWVLPYKSIKRKGEITLPPQEEKKARQKSASPPKTVSEADRVFEKHTTEKAAANYKRPPVVLEPAKSKCTASSKVFSTWKFRSQKTVRIIFE
uniref:Ig-like domain-containing protein n=1 Tax=Parascaris equorum TaxID=6256 RepID=A0A914SBL1_PAREQ